ncbi:MAG: hypothetical protein M5R40_10370 [Anaerolineae bacterium]|nr:hypothetical protein [Anaerolineae bacterium]
MRKLLALLVVFALSVAVLPTGAQEMDFDCGTDQEVVLQFISGTVGGEHEATVAVVENYADVCPNVVVNVLTRPTSTTETLAPVPAVLRGAERRGGRLYARRVLPGHRSRAPG